MKTKSGLMTKTKYVSLVLFNSLSEALQWIVVFNQLSYHVQGLLLAHDDVAAKNYGEDIEELPPSSPTPPPERDFFNPVTDAIRMVGIRKNPNEPLVKLDFQSVICSMLFKIHFFKGTVHSQIICLNCVILIIVTPFPSNNNLELYPI